MHQCPLCLLGLPEPHTKGQRELLKNDKKLQAELYIIERRREDQEALERLDTDHG